MSVTDIRVFMGGTCAGYKWRDDLVKLVYGNARMFNPIVKNWNETHRLHEVEQRQKADVALYVLTPDMAGVYSVAEVVDDSNKRPTKTVLCILDRKGFDRKTNHSLQAVCNLVLENGGCVYESLHDVADHINLLCEYALQFKGERLAHLCKVAHVSENRIQRQVAKDNGERVKLSPTPQNSEVKKMYEILHKNVTIGNVRKFKGIHIECPFCRHEYSIRHNDLAHRGKRCPQCSAQAMKDGFSYRTSRY